MRVGDLVMYKYDLIRQPPVDGAPVGIVTHIDDGAPMNHSMEYLEVISESR